MPEAPVSPDDATARIAALEASLARAHAALAARDLLIDTLRGQIARLRRMQFGASSEKLGREIEQLELALEELETERDGPALEAATPGDTARPAPVRSLPDHLPREEIVHEPPSGACTCPGCGGVLRRLGVDAHEMLDIVPVRWRVVRVVRPKYSCRVCEKIVQASAPAHAVAHGKATFATLAHVVVSKFDHHLPLYRQAEVMAAQGLDIDRSTLAGWTGQAAALLDPIVGRIRDAVLKADKIHADDTPVPVLDPGRARPRPGGCGSTRPTTRPRVARHRARHGIASPLTAPAPIRRRISPASGASSRLMPMPAMTGCTGRA
jgi:transposase